MPTPEGVLRVGLTGGIATGKSTVSRQLADKGAVVIDADEIARVVVRPGEPALAEIAARFGDAMIRPDGRLDRAALGTLVFADGSARRDLEAITHPRIRERMARDIAAAMQSDSPLVIVDIPLMFENGRDAEFEGVVLVYATPEQQLQRVVQRDGLSRELAQQRIASQMDINAKRERATWVIDNSGSPAATAHAVDAWWDEVVGERAKP